MADQQDHTEAEIKQDDALGSSLGVALQKCSEQEKTEWPQPPDASPITLLVGKGTAPWWDIFGSADRAETRHWALSVHGVVWEMFYREDKSVLLKESLRTESGKRFKESFEVGFTTMKKDEISDFANRLVQNIDEYDIIKTNCQTFVMRLIKEIKLGQEWILEQIKFKPPYTLSETLQNLFASTARPFLDPRFLSQWVVENPLTLRGRRRMDAQEVHYIPLCGWQWMMNPRAD
ncbi:MAG: hypothetical protein M1821_009875 [Bathelium mastoideum]|nr:MAG: hypothetical protein M1821_009875 [Bathelium mastoideum]KAI9690367.1 MAG: hypothetical protein M1822_009329 [Bathelium mastoideum]